MDEEEENDEAKIEGEKYKKEEGKGKKETEQSKLRLG